MKPLRLAILACFLVLGTACSSTEATSTSSTTSAPSTPDLELSVEWGCGFGFYVSNESQTSGLILAFNDVTGAFSGDVPQSSRLPDPAWSARFDVGKDLFANWCDDVIEPDEPERIVLEEWDVIEGTIEITSLPGEDGGPATAALRGIVILGPQGQTVQVPDMDVTNRGWGFFAG